SVAHDAENQRIGEAAVAIIELRERLRVAPLQADDEVSVAAGGVDCENERQEHHRNSNASIVYTREMRTQMLASRRAARDTRPPGGDGPFHTRASRAP